MNCPGHKIGLVIDDIGLDEMIIDDIGLGEMIIGVQYH